MGCGAMCDEWLDNVARRHSAATSWAETETQPAASFRGPAGFLRHGTGLSEAGGRFAREKKMPFSDQWQIFWGLSGDDGRCWLGGGRWAAGREEVRWAANYLRLVGSRRGRKHLDTHLQPPSKATMARRETATE